MNGRGGTDWRWSHDFEDLVYIFNYNKNIVEELQKADDDLKGFFKEEFAKILKRTYIREEIECKLPYGEENRVYYIIEMIEKLSQLCIHIHFQMPRTLLFAETFTVTSTR